MSIIELQKEDLARLTDTQLEELIARLCEAELAAYGGKLRDVFWSGSITAPDGGVDIRVTASNGNFDGDFILRSDTVFQAKAKPMRRAEVLNEMRNGEELSAIVKELAEVDGAYIIASTEDCSPPTYKKRIKAMREAITSDPHTTSLAINYYDRSCLHRWLRQYPSVQLWLRDVLGRPLSGWRPFGRWSSTPIDIGDSLILEEGITVNIPSSGHKELSLEEAILAVRRLILSSKKTIRITGLSGVGKSRFVQALFEEDVGEEVLDRTAVIYADIGNQPDPSAHTMIETLLAQQASIIVVLDNCQSELHSTLSERLRSHNNSLKLITVEYDIREDKPQTTEVVQIEANGPKVAEKLLIRRHPELGQLNAAKIAEFSEGNARLALAIAESAPIDGTLSRLTDEQLFNRLFYQRHKHDSGLKEQAEVLSLVYSFSIGREEGGVDELSLLGELCEYSKRSMHRAIQTLVERQVAQQRARWRAILPHVIANRLATDALNKIPADMLAEIFERRASPRLLKSFGRRLGFLHKHPVAIKIVSLWMSDGGFLSDPTQFNEHERQLFRYIAPVAPERTLDLIERTLTTKDLLVNLRPSDPFRLVSLNLLVGLAYYPEYFERAVEVLLQVAEHEDTENNYDSVRGKLKGLFQLYLSGTHANLEQRASVVRVCLCSNVPTRQEIGLKLLSSALESDRWSGHSMMEFGARPRDYGHNPNFDERLQWLRRFIKISVEVSNFGESTLASSARQLVASRFRFLWRYPDLRPDLYSIALDLNDKAPWLEGWRAVCSALYYDYRKSLSSSELESVKSQLLMLKDELSPKDLVSKIEALVINPGQQSWLLDDEFDEQNPKKYEDARVRLENRAFGYGEQVGKMPAMLQLLAMKLFDSNHAPNRMAFGRGLMSSSAKPRWTWDILIEALHSLESKLFNYSVLSGALEELSNLDKQLTFELLNEAADDELLKPIIVGLHPYSSFSEVDFDRCVNVFESIEGHVQGIERLFWQDEYLNVAYSKLVDLAKKLLFKANGDCVLLEALTMRLHGKVKSEDILGEELRKIALRAAASHLTKNDPEPGGLGDYRLTEVLSHCLPFKGCVEEKTLVLDALFNDSNGALEHMYWYGEAVTVVVKHLTSPFLTRALLEGDVQDYLRFHISEGEPNFKNPLENVSSKDLIDWCINSGDEKAWKLIAGIIAPFDSTQDDKACKLSEQALAILNAAPNSVEVLDIYVDAVSPMSCSGIVLI